MRNTAVKHIKSLILPLTALIIIPTILLWATDNLRIGWGLGMPRDMVPILFGFVLMGYGLYLLSITIRLFMIVGKGTLAPWSPTQQLVVIGPYRHVRNPMISSVLITLLGETILVGSIWLLTWFICFFIINHFYFIYSEEPGLISRFGGEYLQYHRNVPRWIPALKPWIPDKKDA